MTLSKIQFKFKRNIFNIIFSKKNKINIFSISQILFNLFTLNPKGLSVFISSLN
jgi:hypothetical protein